MKTLILIALYFSVVACTMSTPPTDAPTTPAPQATGATADSHQFIKIESADKACVQDADCEVVMTACSCHCGEGVAKIHVQKYRDQQEATCKDYQGKMCKMLCNGEAKCEKKVCTYVN